MKRVMEKTHVCDFCGGGFVGEWRLLAHEKLCEKTPPEIRAKGRDAVKLYWQRQRLSAFRENYPQTAAGLNVARGSMTGDGEWICDFEGCGLGCKSGQGLGKHRLTCMTRTPAEREGIRTVLKERHKYGQAYLKRQKARPRLLAQPPALGPALDAPIASNGNTPSPHRIEPTPMFQNLVGSTQVSFSVDLRGLLELGLKHLPELLQLVQSVQLERKP